MPPPSSPTPPPTPRTHARASLLEAQALLAGFLADARNAERIERVADLLAERFVAGNKVMICGNGGSSADAMHFAEELTGRFRAERRPLPALACTDPGHITCTANDYGYEQVFSRWVKALGKPGDVLVVLSTSGNSVNILHAVEAARACAIDTIALLGKGGGKLANTCEYEWIVRPATELPAAALTADRIQEIHMLVLHTLIECVERRLFPENYR